MENQNLKNHLVQMFTYNDWATKTTIESTKGMTNKDERLTELLSHIIAAQKVWLNRVLGEDTHTNPWEKYVEDEFGSLSTNITTEWISLLEKYNDQDLDKRIEYRNLKGEKFVNTVKDIAVHVINHSTYHRAQIAQRIRQLGGSPAVTDYIVYKRAINLK